MNRKEVEMKYSEISIPNSVNTNEELKAFVLEQVAKTIDEVIAGAEDSIEIILEMAAHGNDFYTDNPKALITCITARTSGGHVITYLGENTPDVHSLERESSRLTDFDDHLYNDFPEWRGVNENA